MDSNLTDDFPTHNPFTYCVEEATNILDRNEFVLRYLEAITHATFD